MIKLQRILLGAILLISIHVYSQQPDTLVIPKSAIKLSLLGSLIYPGLRVGAELPVRVKQVIHEKKNKTKTVLKVKSLTFNLAFYHQKTFHDNVYLTTEWQMRRQRERGWFAEFSPGIGMSRTFISGTTYRVTSNGDVSIEKLAGYNYAMVTLAGAVGYDFFNKKKIPLKAYSKLSVIGMFPYNSFIYPRPTLELGIIYTPKSFFKTNPSLRIKRK